MSLTSLPFFTFLAATAVVYFFLVPKKFQWCVLLLASYVFYAFAGWKLFAYILFTTTTVFFSGLWINRITEKKHSGGSGQKKAIIAFTLLVNFGVLAAFKWYSTLVGLFEKLTLSLFSSAITLPEFSLLLPLGISFYTFQAAGYLIDIYRGKIHAERNYFRFALFVSFFPQLVQGPISRHSELAEQLYSSRAFSYTEARRGFQLMLWGLFKKLVIADRLVLVVKHIYGFSEHEYWEYSGAYLFVGLLASALQLYTDFSGGVDIARGSGQILGIHMPVNFTQPMFASSLPDYWRRWHISLNNWWRDYLFYPLVLSKPISKLSRFIRKYISASLGKVIGVYICINIVRLVNAMWHGADSYYVASGLYYGVLMVLGMVLEPVFRKTIKVLRINTHCASWKLFQITRTFLLVVLSKIFWEARGVKNALTVCVNMVKDFNPWLLRFNEGLLFGLSSWDAGIVGISLLLLLAADIAKEKGIALRETLEKQNIVFQWLIVLGGIFAVLLWGRYGFGYDETAFIYRGF